MKQSPVKQSPVKRLRHRQEPLLCLSLYQSLSYTSRILATLYPPSAAVNCPVRGKKVAFACHLNSYLTGDPFLKHLLPLDPEGNDFFSKFEDGVLLCRLVCLAIPGSVGTCKAYRALSFPCLFVAIVAIWGEILNVGLSIGLLSAINNMLLIM